MASASSLVAPARLANVLLLALCALLVLWQPAFADDAPPADEPAAESATPAPLPDDATLRKMKVKELKGLLARKGADAACVACTSRGE